MKNNFNNQVYMTQEAIQVGTILGMRL